SPILEYQAPRAFFIGSLATYFQFFDERTWQAGLAPTEKVSQLAVLDEASLKSVFGKFPSVNSELRLFLSRLTDTAIEQIGGGTVAAWAFAGVRCGALQPPPMVATNEVARQLFEAERCLRSGSSSRPQAIAMIHQILDSTPSYRSDLGWSATYYACLAAHAS